MGADDSKGVGIFVPRVLDISNVIIHMVEHSLGGSKFVRESAYPGNCEVVSLHTELNKDEDVQSVQKTFTQSAGIRQK